MSSQAKEENYLKQVRDQYENYPYPPRDPEDEQTKGLRLIYSCALDSINHYHYQGKKDFSHGFRALVAGGGTGDAAIALAAQLRHTDANVVYLDFSEPSMQVAQARARKRGLTNITWIRDSLLNAPQLFSEKFDFINCSGVLHHLASPEAGLAALANVLKEDGVLDIMLYAPYGRASVYHMQQLLRLINRDESNLQTQIDNCKTILRNLPETNAFQLFQNKVTDIRQHGDSGIYDLLLHSQDRAYSIPELYDLLASAQLRPNHFFANDFPQGNAIYTLEAYFSENTLDPLIQQLSLKEKQTAAELMHGDLIKHQCYASRTSPPPASLNDTVNIPAYSIAFKPDIYQAIAGCVPSFPDGVQLQFSNRIVKFPTTLYTQTLLTYLDGKNTLAEIATKTQNALSDKPALTVLAAELETIFNAFNHYDLMFLRHHSIPSFETTDEINTNTPFNIS